LLNSILSNIDDAINDVETDVLDHEGRIYILEATTPDSTIDELNGKVDKEANKSLILDSLITKLQGLDSSKWLGEYPNLDSLIEANPSPVAGNYGYVNVENSVPIKYVWDSNDSEFVERALGSDETAATILTKLLENTDTENFTVAYKTALDSLTGNLDSKVDKEGTKVLSDTNFTQTEKDNLAQQSGTNTGDQDLSGLYLKRTNKTVTASSYILLAADVDKFLIFSNACTVVVPNGLDTDLEFQGKQGGTGQVTFSAEAGGTLNVPSVFLAETAEQHCFFGIRTNGGDVSTILGTLKLA
jgi:hypothetical protein